MQAAATAVQQAREALERAKQVYQRSCERAAEQRRRTSTLTLGDLWDGTLELVRRYPAAGVVVAGVIGFLVGRTGRR